MINKIKTLLKRGLPKCMICYRRIWPSERIRKIGIGLYSETTHFANAHFDCYGSWEHGR